MKLAEALTVAADCAVVLVVSDYDGTLAPIVADPDLAFPDGRALSALVALGELPDTHAAILSGRDAAVLERLTGGPAGVELVGSHGAERAGLTPEVEDSARQDLGRALGRLEALLADFPGSHLERKPAGVAFHYRNVAAALRLAAESAARKVGEDFPALSTLAGKRVVELSGSQVDKGDALGALRDQWDAGVVVFHRRRPDRRACFCGSRLKRPGDQSRGGRNGGEVPGRRPIKRRRSSRVLSGSPAEPSAGRLTPRGFPGPGSVPRRAGSAPPISTLAPPFRT